MSYKVEVRADGESGWNSNLLRFATEERARKYGENLAWRWTLVQDWRIVETDDPLSEGETTTQGRGQGSN